MTEMEVIAGRPVRIETAELEPVRVRVLPDGRMDTRAAKAPETIEAYRSVAAGQTGR